MKNNPVNIANILASPKALRTSLPATDAALKVVHTARSDISNMLSAKDKRLLVVVGPCSVHSKHSALTYANQLQQVQAEFANELCIVMRAYFEKPRTNIGWKGFINDPRLDGSYDVGYGLTVAREILLEINEMGVPIATEFLDPIVPQYISDLVSWGAIGARTTESQVHRELVSGLPMPVGFKNGTDGNIEIAIDAVRTAQSPHNYLNISEQGQVTSISTKGNHQCHIVLRGSKDDTNYHTAKLESVAAQLRSFGLMPKMMVDCSHGNSQYNYKNQLRVVTELCEQLQRKNTHIFGVMLESHLQENKQLFEVGCQPNHRQSITDACLGWEDTYQALSLLREAVLNEDVVRV